MLILNSKTQKSFLVQKNAASLLDQQTALMQDEYRQEAGSVVEVDYYNATSLLGLTDEQLIQRTLHTYLAACHPAYGLCQVQDASVLK